jgi:hypothetical protein
MAKRKLPLWQGQAEAMQTRAEVFHANLTDDLADFTVSKQKVQSQHYNH